MTAWNRDQERTPDVERLYSSVFLTVALFGYAAADTRSRFSHGKVEKGERHIPTTWNACLYRTKRGLPKVKCRKAMKTLKCGVLNIHHGNRVPIVVCGRESRLHGKGEQWIIFKTERMVCETLWEIQLMYWKALKKKHVYATTNTKDCTEIFIIQNSF